MKRISPGTVTVGVIAVLFGLVAAYVARHCLGGPAVERRQAQTATLIVPKVNLAKYSRIREEDLETTQVAIDKVPEGAVRIGSRALFRLVKNTIMAGQPILEEDLYGVGEVPLLADQLPPGYRTVTLQVDANSALNGMIQPESHVDITLTVRDEQPELGGLATLTLLRGVKVLATSQARFPRSEDRPANLRNITVAVSPKQANKLILAQRYGTLSITLRSSLEDDLLADAGAEDDRDLVNPNDLLGLVVQSIPEPVTKTAQIWRGGKMQQLTFEVSEIEESLDATAVAEGHQATPARPVSSQGPTTAKPGCTDCEKKKQKQQQRTLAAPLPKRRRPAPPGRTSPRWPRRATRPRWPPKAGLIRDRMGRSFTSTWRPREPGRKRTDRLERVPCRPIHATPNGRTRRAGDPPDGIPAAARSRCWRSGP